MCVMCCNKPPGFSKSPGIFIYSFPNGESISQLTVAASLISNHNKM